jgi:REP element-mobilizing transposase RayT
MPDQADPIAYFLTWTTYGTWLPGDERGWYAKPGIWSPGDARLQQWSELLMTEDAFRLNPHQRSIVEAAIEQHCQYRGWLFHAVHARSNHVHALVTATSVDPDIVLTQFKARCTRKLREAYPELKDRQHHWTENGSKRKVFTEPALQDVLAYVVEQPDGQRFADT